MVQLGTFDSHVADIAPEVRDFERLLGDDDCRREASRQCLLSVPSGFCGYVPLQLRAARCGGGNFIVPCAGFHVRSTLNMLEVFRKYPASLHVYPVLRQPGSFGTLGWGCVSG